MDRIRIIGGQRLNGSIPISGAKNATLPLMIASLLTEDTPWPHADGVDLAGSCDVYDLRRDERFVDLEGKLLIEWGEGARYWVQHADRQNKAIVELRPKFEEQEFPGFLNLMGPLSKVEGFPKNMDCNSQERDRCLFADLPQN